MQNTEELERKLEELIGQLNTLLAQLSGEETPTTPPTDVAKQDPLKMTENLEKELQRLKAKREDTDRTERIVRSHGQGSKNGWNYISSYLQNRF